MTVLFVTLTLTCCRCYDVSHAESSMILDELHERTNGGSVWIGLERKVESKRFCDIVHTKKDMYVYLFVRVLPLVRGDVISSTIIQLILGSGMTRHLWITFSGRRTSPTGRAVSACACTSTTSREAGTTMTVPMNRRLCAKQKKVKPLSYSFHTHHCA